MTERPAELVDALYAQTVRKGDRLFGERYYGPFLNWGYWKSDTADQVEACRNLVELVASGVPIGRRVLDVGSGLGGVVEYLHGAHPTAELTGINVQRDQLEVARARVPAARFVEMDATSMTFDDETFDTVVCVEAAFHFPSRARFLEGALRVLRPGGHLAMADILSVPLPGEESSIATPADYQALLYRVGFTEVRVSDVTRETSWAHAAYAIDFLQHQRALGAIDDALCEAAIWSRVARAAACRHYVIIAARKPVRPSAWTSGETYLGELQRRLVATAGI